MARTSGRFSRFPAVNREVAVDDVDVVPGPDQEADEVVAESDVVVPDGMTIAETLDWIGDDSARREAALSAEKASGKPRSTLVEALED